ncbi:MAG TPA: HNH endonuclease signature motif containing protein [Chitinophagaceae bacterium]|nr:HNH endonuclease signature motif containing protein [Chitinophagaceae bacterium]
MKLRIYDSNTLPSAQLYRSSNKDWTPAEDEYLEENYELLTRKELAADLRTTETIIKERLKKLKITKSGASISRQFKRKNSGQFIKGQLPHNTLRDGIISIRKDERGKEYAFIRTSQNKWVHLHRYNWEKENGPVPKGFILRFKDGDTLNPDVSNLQLITKAQHLFLNSIKAKRID